MAHPLTGFLLSSNCRKQRQLRLFSTSLYSSPGEAEKDLVTPFSRQFTPVILRWKRPWAFLLSPLVTTCDYGLLRRLYTQTVTFILGRPNISKLKKVNLFTMSGLHWLASRFFWCALRAHVPTGASPESAR